MKAGQPENKDEKVESRRKVPIVRQGLNLWRSVMNLAKTIPKAIGILPKRSAPSASKRAQKSAFGLINPRSARNRQSSRIVGRAAQRNQSNKLKTSPGQQRGTENRPSAAKSSESPNSQNSRLIDRVLKGITGGTSRTPPTGGNRTSKISRNSAKRSRTKPNSVPSAIRGSDSEAAESKIHPETILKKRPVQRFVARNPNVQNGDELQHHLKIWPGHKPRAHLRMLDRDSSLPNVLKLPMPQISPPEKPILGIVADLLSESKSQRDSLGSKGQRPDQGPSSSIQDATGTTPESTDGETSAEDQSFDQPAGGKPDGWPASTHSIMDARFNNVPKRPLRPLR